MKSYNNVTIVGRSVRDAEVKDLGKDNTRASFTLAVDRPYKDSDGKHPTDFLSIVAHGKLAEICGDYIKKSCLVLVSGRIQSRSYEVDGDTKWLTEIIADSVSVLEYSATKSKKEEKAKVTA